MSSCACPACRAIHVQDSDPSDVTDPELREAVSRRWEEQAAKEEAAAKRLYSCAFVNERTGIPLMPSFARFAEQTYRRATEYRAIAKAWATEERAWN